MWRGREISFFVFCCSPCKRQREMGRAAKREHLRRLVDAHAKAIYDTFQMFERPVSSSLEKVEWSQVTKLGEDISKQATITGMLWSGETPDVGQVEEHIAVYCNILQGFLLLCHGNTVGAGPTLLANVYSSAKQVIDRSISLLREPISSYGYKDPNTKVSIPQLSGSVWEVCDALKKVPTSNHIAVGRAITQVAVSMRDVLREMKELKVATSRSDESSTGLSETGSCNHEEDGSEEDDFGKDLSLEEMKNAELVISVVSNTLTVVKEVIRFISGMVKGPNPEGSSEKHMDFLERLLKHCQEIGGQIDELGACVYPPQEVSLMKSTVLKMTDEVESIKEIVDSIRNSAEDFCIASEVLKASLLKLQSAIVSADDDLVPEMGKLGI